MDISRCALATGTPYIPGFAPAGAAHILAPLPAQSGPDIRTVQARLGHKDVTTTMIYTHVPNTSGHSRVYSVWSEAIAQQILVQGEELGQARIRCNP